LLVILTQDDFARHSGAGRRRFSTAEGWSSSASGLGYRDNFGRAFVVLPPACRLRGGRFDRLPPLESLFFCWPKRKVTQRKWPSGQRLIAFCWIRALGPSKPGTSRSP